MSAKRTHYIYRSMVDDLLEAIPRLWRGSRLPAEARHTLPTGFAALDRELPGGGWPIGAVVELLADTPGIGEFSLCLPAVRQLTLADNRVLCIRPPHLLNAPALERAGIEPGRLLVLDPEDDRAALWSAEEALRNPACGAVFLWCGTRGGINDSAVRRLQVAARDGQSILFLYRTALKQVSRWAALRLELLPGGEGLQISILKAAGAKTGTFWLFFDHLKAGTP